MYLVVAYDVVSDSRRARLRRRLVGFLTPVQRSVFEGEIHASRLGTLRSTLLRCINPRTDDVRLYTLCKACRASTELLGTAFEVEPRDGPLVV